MSVRKNTAAVLLASLPALALCTDLRIQGADPGAVAGNTREIDGNLIIQGSTLSGIWSLMNVTTIQGNLEIRENSRIRSLDWLKNLARVAGRVIIDGNNALMNLTGLDNLREAASLEILNNNALVSIAGFELLGSIACNLDIYNNLALETVDGFNQLAGVSGEESTITNCAAQGLQGPRLSFRSNTALASISGFDGVTAHGLQIRENPALVTVSALANLRNAFGEFTIEKNQALLQLPAVQLEAIAGYIRICNNPALIKFDTNIRTMHFYGGLKPAFSVEICNNSALQGITFRNAQLIDGSINITGNPNLVSIVSTAAVTIGGALVIDNNEFLRSISLAVISLEGRFAVTNNRLLREISVRPLWSVNDFLQVSNNDWLTDLDLGIGSVRGHFHVFDNPSLEHLNCSSLTTVLGDLFVSSSGVGIWIGFPRLRDVQGSVTLTTPEVPTRAGPQRGLFPSLLVVGGDLIITYSTATVLDGFSKLAKVGALKIILNRWLESISGFAKLVEIQGILHISQNPLLKKISGFGNLGSMGKLQMDDLPELVTVEGMYGIRENCSMWGVPTTYGLECTVTPEHVVCICLAAVTLFIASFCLVFTCRTRLPIAEVTRVGGRIVVRTKRPHNFRDNGSFCVRFAGTGCDAFDSPHRELRASVTSSTEFEVLGCSIEGMLEDSSLTNSLERAALGVVSIRARDELRLMCWGLPFLCWVVILFGVWFLISWAVQIETLDYLLLCGMSVGLGVVVPGIYRLIKWVRRESRCKERFQALVQADLLRRLDAAAWTEDEEAKNQIREELLHIGWSQEKFDAKWNELLVQHSQEAGVSIAYLLSEEFRSLAQTRSGKSDPTFYDLKDAFFVCPDALGVETRCPRDGRPGCALVDWLPRRHRGPCTHFLSWTWGYRLSQVCGALEQWLDQTRQDPERTFVFMCFFVNNQHRILVEQSFCGSDSLGGLFESNLRRIGKMIALLDDWNQPRYLSRIWTVYEQYTAVKLGIDVEIIIPPTACESLVHEIQKGEAGIKRVKRSLCHVDAEHARAWCKQDEENVKKEIQDTIGFQTVNSRVCEFMVAWVARQVENHFRKLVLVGTTHRTRDRLGSGDSTASPSATL